jgi:glycosyltransferase involved in cell wall biosynthesis
MLLRSSVRSAKRRVLVHGLPYFGRMFADLMCGGEWIFRYYPDQGLGNLTGMACDLWKCDLAYQIGGRVTLGKFLRTAKWLGRRNIVMHWVGTDTLDEQKVLAEREADPWVIQGLHHWAESDWIAQEVGALGMSCDLVPLPSTRIPDFPSPLPEDFSVLVYVPDIQRAHMYGLADILQVARDLPEIPFELVGFSRGRISNPPGNLRVHGRIPDLREFYRKATIVWRPVRHDGLSFMVLEALGFGRHVLWSYEFPGCLHVTSALDAHRAIQRLYSLHRNGCLPLNRAGVQVIEKRFRPQRVKETILTRLESLLERRSSAGE